MKGSISRAVVFDAYGAPQVLQVRELALPLPGAREVRVRVRSAGVQQGDVDFRSGAVQRWMAARFPQRLGNEFAGVVEAIGAGAGAVRVGDEVLGWSLPSSYADHVVAASDQFVAKPRGMPWPEAGALGDAAQVASCALDQLRVGPGDVLLVHGAGVGIGHLAVQLARSRGARVIGVDDPRRLADVEALGVTALASGPGLAGRVAAAAPYQGVSAALVTLADEMALRVSLEVCRDRDRIGTAACMALAEEVGVQRIRPQRSAAQLAEMVRLYDEGRLQVPVHTGFSLENAAEAHRLVEDGGYSGHVVLAEPPP